jgi:ATP-dependent helicase HrpA
MAKVRQLREAYAEVLAGLPPGQPVPAGAGEIPWMIEELRVSYFAHALGTAYPVSDKRIWKAIDAVG